MSEMMKWESDMRVRCLQVFVFSAVTVFTLCTPASAAPKDLWVEQSDITPIIDLQLPSFAPVIEKLGVVVVNISTEGEEKVSSPLAGTPFPFSTPQGDREQLASPFDQLFQSPQNEITRPFSSLGSGFVINSQGLVVTNYHVVEKAQKISVTFRDDKKSYDAKLVGGDKKTDLALLQVEGRKNFKAAILGDSDNLQPGDWVIAIGNPFRLGHTATVGIVSAKSRRVGGGPYDDFIQTDASINPGNSGGPLFNARGEVVGVSTAIFSPGALGSTGFNIGIGFATPINLVKRVISELHEKGRVTRGWLGVLIQPVSADVAEALQLESPRGALVADVMNESPAAKGGIQRGDVIVQFDGKDVTENDDLPLMVAETGVGKRVKVDIIRAGKRSTLEVRIAELKDEEPVVAEQKKDEESKLGLSVQDITPDIARTLGLESSEGVIVSNVVSDGAASKSGIRRGDIILEVDSKVVKTAQDFRKVTRDIKKGKPVLLLLRRNNENTIFLTLKVE